LISLKAAKSSPTVFQATSFYKFAMVSFFYGRYCE